MQNESSRITKPKKKKKKKEFGIRIIKRLEILLKDDSLL